MRAMMTGLGLACLALPALAQTQEQRDACFGNTSTADQGIAGCTAIIQSDKEPPATLAMAYYDRSVVYSTKGQLDEAIADDTRAIAIKPDYAHAYAMRGLAYQKKNARDLAIADYRTTLKLDPTNPTAKDGLKLLGVTP